MEAALLIADWTSSDARRIDLAGRLVFGVTTVTGNGRSCVTSCFGQNQGCITPSTQKPQEPGNRTH